MTDLDQGAAMGDPKTFRGDEVRGARTRCRWQRAGGAFRGKVRSPARQEQRVGAGLPGSRRESCLMPPSSLPHILFVSLYNPSTASSRTLFFPLNFPQLVRCCC